MWCCYILQTCALGADCIALLQQCVALQYAAVCHSVLQRAAAAALCAWIHFCCSEMQDHSVAVCCSMSQCVAVWRSVLFKAGCSAAKLDLLAAHPHSLEACYIVLQCVANVLMTCYNSIWWWIDVHSATKCCKCVYVHVCRLKTNITHENLAPQNCKFQRIHI